MTHQRNAIKMAFRWWANNSPLDHFYLLSVQKERKDPNANAYANHVLRDSFMQERVYNWRTCAAVQADLKLCCPATALEGLFHPMICVYLVVSALVCSVRARVRSRGNFILIFIGLTSFYETLTNRADPDNLIRISTVCSWNILLQLE